MEKFNENGNFKEIMNNIDDRYLSGKYKPIHKGFDLLKNAVTIVTLATLIYGGYAWTKSVGASEAQIQSLFNKNNPIVKRKELKREIKSVRHDMGVADTTLFKLSNSKYISLKEAIKDFKKEQRDFKKDIDKKLETQTDRLIEVIKNQK